MNLRSLTDGLLSKFRGVKDETAQHIGLTSRMTGGGYTGYSHKQPKDMFNTGSMQNAEAQQAQPAAAPNSGWQTGRMQQMPVDAQPQPNTGWQPAMVQPNAQAPQPAPAQGNPTETGFQPPVQDNISYMPGTFVGDDGKAYSHVERVVQLLNVQACFRVIEFMRNRESVIVNTESIGNDADLQRCLDMLAGAAFTLGCTLTKITQIKRAYLIAPDNVLVMQDSAVARWSEPQVVGQQMNPQSAAAWQNGSYGANQPQVSYGGQMQFAQPYVTGQQPVYDQSAAYAQASGNGQPMASYASGAGYPRY